MRKLDPCGCWPCSRFIHKRNKRILLTKGRIHLLQVAPATPLFKECPRHWKNSPIVRVCRLDLMVFSPFVFCFTSKEQRACERNKWTSKTRFSRTRIGDAEVSDAYKWCGGGVFGTDDLSKYLRYVLRLSLPIIKGPNSFFVSWRFLSNLLSKNKLKYLI